MDPNSNPTSTPTSTPAQTPPPAPVPPVAPVSPEPASTPVVPAQNEPVSAPASPVGTESSPTLTSPVTSDSALVNPVIQPSDNLVQPPVNPIVKPTGLGVTDPVLMPEKPAEPDPIEEELKAPMKAAEPALGSIGSAVSGPASDVDDQPTGAVDNPFTNKPTDPTPNVSFNDPAVAAGNSVAKPKNKKSTLIALIIIAAMVVIALIAVLVMQFIPMGGN